MTTGNPIPEDRELFDWTTKLIYVGDDKTAELKDCVGSQIPYYLRYGVDNTQKEEENTNDRS